MNEETIRRLVDQARVGRLATTDPDGRPNLVPLVFVLDSDTLYSTVDEKPKAAKQLRRVRNLTDRPDRVAVLVDHYDEEWPELWWVRMRGRARILDSGPERDRALARLREKYPQYRSMPPSGPVIAIDVDDWRGWSWRPLQ